MSGVSQSKSNHQQPQHQHQLPPVVHAIGGSIGSALSILIFYPLERVRVELQSKAGSDNCGNDHCNHDEKKIDPYSPQESIIQCLLRLHEEKTLYKGASNLVTTLTISNAIFFYVLQVTRRRLSSIQHDNRRRGSNHNQQYKHSLFFYIVYSIIPKSKMGKSLLASTIAGCINVLLTNPLWVASLRIMESKIPKDDSDFVKDDKHKQQPTLWNVMNRIVQSEGVSHLWNGTATSLLLVSNPIIQHFLYEQLRSMRLVELTNRNRRRMQHQFAVTALSPVKSFLFGAVAKAMATIVTYPLQLAQVLLRLQTKKKLQSNNNTTNTNQQKHTKHRDNNNVEEVTKYEGMIDCLISQYTYRGIPGLFQGMNAKLLQTVLTAAFTFVTYEQTLALVGRVYHVLGSERRVKYR